MANYVIAEDHYHKECMAFIKTSFLVHTEVGINYLQFLNGPQIEAWTLYNAVRVVNINLCWNSEIF